MSGLRQHRWAVIFAAFLLFAGVTAFRFLGGSDVGEGIVLLYLLPIGLPTMSSQPLRPHGRWRRDRPRSYAVAKDVTERKRLEEEREELLGRVEAIARTDQLTGLPNRRSWEEEVRQAISRAQRQGHPLAVAMIDLDSFKRFNDEQGHQAGDAVLREAGASWRMTLRVTDFIARYGGEEFAVLLPDCPPDEALGVLARLRAATPQNQTCSAGVAYWDRSESSEALVGRADAALYEAKRAGRDRVVSSG